MVYTAFYFVGKYSLREAKNKSFENVTSQTWAGDYFFLTTLSDWFNY